MLWIITKDKINKGQLNNFFRTHGAQRQAIMRQAEERDKPAIIEGWKKQCGDEFRLLDDDGEVYFEGVCLDLDNQDGDGAFEPLDWAEPLYGCTTMEYRKKGETKWKVL